MGFRIAIMALTLPVAWACSSPPPRQQERPEAGAAAVPQERPEGRKPGAGSERKAPVRHRIMVGEHPARVRLAVSSEERLQGLQGVPKLAEDEGMLFVYPQDREHLGFWMKGCLVALDIAFLDARGRVLNVVTLQPPGADAPDDELPRAQAAGRCRMVLEMRAGWFAKRGLGPGCEVRIPADLLAPKRVRPVPPPRR
jgi:uncharacterized membrane protein (UPF0127 family)